MRYQGVMPLRIFFLDDHEVVRRGIEVCRDICSAHPEVACVMLTSFADGEALFASTMAGTSG